MKKSFVIAAAAATFIANAALAQDVRITTFKSDSTFSLNGRTFTVSRNQDTSATLQGDHALTSRACPPNCLQPMQAAPGVTTIGEVEVLAFLEGGVTSGTGLLLDARAPVDFAQGAIPGAVNVPFETLNENNRYRNDILRALGALDGPNEALEFSGAMTLTLYSGGAWSGDAARGIDYLLAAGYPPEKLFFYRGGLQAWASVGLTIHHTQNPG